MKIFRGMISIFLISVLISCDAPRTNPLDPMNPDYQFASIEGTIQTESVPHQPIAGVKVFWKNSNIIVQSNGAGKFLIDKLPQTQGWIYFEKEGYSTDSLNINLINQKSQYIEKYLNLIPKLDDLVIYSSILNRYPDVQSDFLYVKAKISDAENDVSAVFVRCSELLINKALSLQSSSGYYENTFSPGDLGLNSIDEGIGKNFEISVYDKSGKEFKIGFSTIKRTIRQDLTFQSPANLDVVKYPVKFVWNRFLPGYKFTYIFEIYTIGDTPVLKKQITNINREDIEITPDIRTLTPGEYFWVIWVVDDFQNRARSRPASFVIQ